MLIAVIRSAPVFIRALTCSDQADAYVKRQKARKRKDVLGECIVREPAREVVRNAILSAFLAD